MDMEIRHEEERCRFSLEVDGYQAYVEYRLEQGDFDIRHTIVPAEIGGRGIASRLVKAAYDYARSNGFRLLATCSYAVLWLERHPEYEGVKSCDYAGEGACAL